MKAIKLVILFLSLGIITVTANAQDDCDNALYEANKLYENGNIDDAIDRLETCIGNHMTDEERFESYKLLASAYGDIKDNEQRDEYLKLMLRLKPYYQNKPNNDSKEITRSLSRFTVVPQIHAGLTVGTHINNPKLKESFSALYVNQKYIPTGGYQFGLTLNYHLFDKTSATFLASVRGMGIHHEMLEDGRWQKDYTELITTSQFSVGALQYVNLTRRIRAFGGLDLGLGFVHIAKVNVKTENFTIGTIDQSTKDVIKERTRVLPNLGIKTGLAFQLEIAVVTLDLGFSSYGNTTTKSDERYVDQDFILATQYVNDDIVPKLLMLNVGFSIPITYKITK